MRIVNLPSDFHSPRNGYSLDAIVLHTTEGSDSRTWLTKTGSVSANELLRNENGEGVAYVLVEESLAAWHAGRIVGVPTTPLYAAHSGANPNQWTYGFEIEGHAAGPVDPALVELVVARIRSIRSRHGNVPVINHADLSPGDRTDPGIWRAPIDAALEDDMTPQDKRDLLDKIDDSADANLIWALRAQRGIPIMDGSRADDPAKEVLSARQAARAARPAL